MSILSERLRVRNIIYSMAADELDNNEAELARLRKSHAELLEALESIANNRLSVDVRQRRD